MGYIPTKKVLVASDFNPNGNYQLAKEHNKAPHTHACTWNHQVGITWNFTRHPQPSKNVTSSTSGSDPSEMIPQLSSLLGSSEHILGWDGQWNNCFSHQEVIVDLPPWSNPEMLFNSNPHFWFQWIGPRENPQETLAENHLNVGDSPLD